MGIILTPKCSARPPLDAYSSRTTCWCQFQGIIGPFQLRHGFHRRHGPNVITRKCSKRIALADWLIGSKWHLQFNQYFVRSMAVVEFFGQLNGAVAYLSLLRNEWGLLTVVSNSCGHSDSDSVSGVCAVNAWMNVPRRLMPKPRPSLNTQLESMTRFS